MVADLMRGLGRRPAVAADGAVHRARSTGAAQRRQAAGAVCGAGQLQAVARGSDAVLHFQWRQSRAGAEKWHSAMVGTRRTPDGARCRRSAGSWPDSAEVAGTGSRPRSAILFSWPSWWAQSQPAQPAAELDHLAETRALVRRGLGPGHHPRLRRAGRRPRRLAAGRRADRCTCSPTRTWPRSAGYVAARRDAAGRLLVRAGRRARPGAGSAATRRLLRDLLGVTVAEHLPLAGPAVVRTGRRRPRGRGVVRAAACRTPDTEVLARYAGGDLDGAPAVTRHGGVFYASAPLPPARRPRAGRPRGRAGRRPAVLPGAPPGLEAVRRGGTLFLLNHTDERARGRGSGGARSGSARGTRWSVPADGDDLMLARQRQARIVDEVRRRGGVRVSDLTSLLDVSDMTVRRDLEELRPPGPGAQGARRRGAGDQQRARSPASRPSRLRELPEKERARAWPRPDWSAPARPSRSAPARRPARWPGTLAAIQDITVVTNSVRVAEAFTATAGPARQTVVLTGGVRTPSDALVGPLADATIRSLHVDVLFLGVHGMDPLAGLTTPNLAEAETNRAFLAHAKKVIVVADHTKWRTVGLCTFGPLSAADVLVTDDRLDVDARSALAETVGELIVAPVVGQDGQAAR